MPLVAISAKVEPEVKAQFDQAFEASEAATKNQFYELLLERFLNPKTQPVEVPTPTADQLAEIEQIKQECQNEIGRLKTAHSLEVDQLKSENEQLETDKQGLADLVMAKPEGLKLEKNQSVLTFPPVIAAVLDKEAEIAKRQTGKEFSRQDILMNSFWESITNGAAYPLKIWSATDLMKLKKQLEAAAE